MNDQLEKIYQIFLKSSGVCTDTRKMKEGKLFFSLSGQQFNGNAYSEEALKKGALAVVIDDKNYSKLPHSILVEDCLDTLQKLANHHRKQSKATIIALTGSNGKTTTKELIYRVLSKSYRTVATQGNLNNHIGVPLTLLEIKADTEMAVVEMGANHQKEIAFLCSIAQPDYGYITNYGKAHLEGFGGVEGVIKGKSELYDYLIANTGKIFFNADDPIQLEKLGGYLNKFGYTTHKKDYFIIKNESIQDEVVLNYEGKKIETKLNGTYNFPNCAAAVIIGKYFNVPSKSIHEALATYIPENNRSQIIEKGDLRIILDAYNANPTSMKAALESFLLRSENPKYVFLGDMFEVGETALEEHQHLVDFIQNSPIHTAYFIGENFAKTNADKNCFHSWEDFEQNALPIQITSGIVLIKGSRGMRMERVIEWLK